MSENGTPLPPGTYRVSELGAELKRFLGEAFAGLWVGGEVQRPRQSRGGHLYFQLVEKGAGDQISATLDAVLFRSDLQRVRRQLRDAGVEIAEGQLVRCSGNVDYYFEGGRLQLVVRDVDPLFSLGALSHRRRQILAALRASNLLDKNRQLDLAAAPLRLAIVASSGSAGVEDFVATLRAGGWPFRLLLIDAAVQGAGAEAQIVRALRRLDRGVRSGRTRVDAYVLIRGGGGRSDLAAFDGQRLAEAIASAERPLLTGLGHEIDESIADRVAHRAFPTPTAVAEFLNQRVAAQDARIADLATRLARGAQLRLDFERRRIDAATKALPRITARVEAARARVAELGVLLARFSQLRLTTARRDTERAAGRLRPPAERMLRRARAAHSEIAGRLKTAARQRLRAADREIAAAARLCDQLSPLATLRRGFSVTIDAQGRTVRSISVIDRGDRLTTWLADGEIRSRVSETRAVAPEIAAADCGAGARASE